MTQNSSNSSSEIENGNTDSISLNDGLVKQKSGKCKYDFVWNNFKKDELDNIKIVLIKLCKRYIWGEEIGESGTPHLQGFMDLKKKMRITELKKYFPLFHFGECRNEPALIEYCQKDGCNIQSFGFPKPIKTLSLDQLYDWELKILELLKTEPDGRKVNWYYETKGNFGKSSFCKYLHIKHNCLVIQGGKLADIMNIIFNTNMDNVQSIVIDVPRVNKNKVSYASLECILNGMITNTKYETGTKVFNPPHVIIFSNYAPDCDEDILSADRWNIVPLRVEEIEAI